MFNLLPASIQNIDSDNVNVFKKSLDSFLSQVPDQPNIAGYGRAAETNSQLHQLPLHCFFYKVYKVLFILTYGTHAPGITSHETYPGAFLNECSVWSFWAGGTYF